MVSDCLPLTHKSKDKDHSSLILGVFPTQLLFWHPLILTITYLMISAFSQAFLLSLRHTDAELPSELL